jgi:hypothetical protein
MAEFKKGDRVRLTRANPCGGATYGSAGEEATVVDDTLPLNSAYGKVVRVKRDDVVFAPVVPVSALVLVTDAADTDDDADRWNAKALREEYRERLNTLTITELPQFVTDLLSEKIDKNVANSVVGLIASAASRVIRDKLKAEG